MRLVALLIVLASGASLAAAAPPSARVALLARGVNLSHWFAQSTQGYADEHLRTFVSDEELRRIRDQGFSHVRLGVEPGMLTTAAFAARLDEAIDRVLKARLAIVVGLHPLSATKDSYLTVEAQDDLRGTWRAFARRMRNFDPERVFIEVMNEPFPLAGTNWRKLQEDAIGIMRAEAPQHTLIANGGGWSGPDDLAAMESVADPSIVYTVHWYGPHLFTHQGATWTWDMAMRIRPLDWPIKRDDAAAVSEAAAKDDEARNIVHYEIASGNFEIEYLERQLQKLEEWRSKHPATTIYVGEFGVYGAQAPRHAMLMWTEAARKALDRHGFGWAYWDFSPGFGLVRETANGRVFEADMLTALGLSAP